MFLIVSGCLLTQILSVVLAFLAFWIVSKFCTMIHSVVEVDVEVKLDFQRGVNWRANERNTIESLMASCTRGLSSPTAREREKSGTLRLKVKLTHANFTTR